MIVYILLAVLLLAGLAWCGWYLWTTRPINIDKLPPVVPPVPTPWPTVPPPVKDVGPGHTYRMRMPDRQKLDLR
jgi:hypothetical protein